jgi:hypothetical protein
MIPVPAAHHDVARHASASSDVAIQSLIALAIVMPFEQLRPVLTLPWQNVTSVELALFVGVAAWTGALIWSREWPRWRTRLTAPWLAVLGVLLLSALAAPSHRGDALKVVARLASGFVIYLMAVNAITSRRRMSFVITAVVATGAVVAAIAVLEYRGVTTILSWLNQYRDGVRVVGGQVRSGATLQYPTIAAMYFEIVLALGTGLLLSVWDSPFTKIARWTRVVIIAAVLLLIAEGLALTFTRAGLLGAAASLAAIALWRFNRRGFDSGVVVTASLMSVVLLLPLWSWSAEAVRLRLSSEGRQGWYRADFNAAKALTMATGEDTFIDVSVINRGRVTWQPGADAPFRASYHWLDGATDRVVQYDGARTELPADIPPGAMATLAMQVRAPETPGRYRLAWDLVQEHRLWFSTETGATLTWTTVDVVPGAAPARPLAAGHGPRVVPPQVAVLGRLTLWHAALGLFAAHPLFGVGPDNFRLTYGPYVGEAHPDPRVHSNSMYFEWLTGAGLVGLLVFGWMLWRADTIARITRRSLTTSAASLYAGVAAAGVAVLVHGLVDSFLTFTPTYVAIALTLGLVAAPSTWTEVARARRV